MPSSARDPYALEQEVEGTFSFSCDDDSPWTVVHYNFPVGNTRFDYYEADDDELEPQSGDQIQRDDPAMIGLNINVGSEILRVNEDEDLVVLRMLKRDGMQRYSDRYHLLKRLVLEGFHYFAPKAPDDVFNMLASFPVGLIQNPDYGLGIRKEYRHVVSMVEKAGADALCITKRRKSGIGGHDYVLNYREFEDLRRAMNALHDKAVAHASEEKRVLAHNALLHRFDPTKYKEESPKLSEDTVYRVLNLGATQQISERNQLAAVRVVKENRKTLSRRHPEALMELKRDIDLVTLEDVIARIESLIASSSTESKWQRFFLDNPFVLSLAFNLPIVLFQDQASVGGRSFCGKGEKIADFLYRHELTNNLTVMEIKKPSTPLLGSEYRHGVFPPSQELAGAITQVLDQRYRLNGELLQILHNSKRTDAERFAIQCMVVAGMTPTESDRQKSFDVFRATLHDVSIITFDEVLVKLKHLHAFLTGKQPNSC